MTPDEWRERVGEPIRLRRRELQIRSMRRAAAAAGISEAVWRQVETGRRQDNAGAWVTPNPSAESRAAICRTLGWSSTSIDLMLAGGDPEFVEYPGLDGPIHLSAHGVDLDALRDEDPEAYDAIMRQAEIALNRARERRPG